MGSGRWQFFKHLHYHGIFKAAGVIWLLLSIASTLPVVVPPSWAKYFVLFPILSRWPWYVWIIGLLVIVLAGTFESAYRAHNTIRSLVAAKEAEIERISKPDKCPVVLIVGWNPGGEWEEDLHQGCFHLQSEGETAHEITLEEFDIEPSVTVASRMVPHIIGHQIGQGSMLAWIKDRNRTDFTKWDLIEAFRHASDIRDGNLMYQKNYCRTLRILYRDHSDFWYSTTQEIIYVPVRGTFEFGPMKHEKLGLRKPA